MGTLVDLVDKRLDTQEPLQTLELVVADTPQEPHMRPAGADTVADTVADTAVADTLVADTLEAALHMRPTGRLLGMQRLLEEVGPARLCCPSFPSGQLRQKSTN